MEFYFCPCMIGFWVRVSDSNLSQGFRFRIGFGSGFQIWIWVRVTSSGLGLGFEFGFVCGLGFRFEL